jgi:hypothetical protein
MSDLVQPDPGDNLVSLHSLAFTLDTDVRTVVAFARELNIPVRDTTFRLTPGQAETVCTYYHLTDGTLAKDKPAEPAFRVIRPV